MRTLIRGAKVVNEGSIQQLDVLIEDGRIAGIDTKISTSGVDREIDARRHYLIPGIIDDQVHFREPGLTHKAEIYTEAKAGLAGGVTSFMEMPNTKPPAFTQELLEEKYKIAANRSLANYSFFMGTSNDNINEVLKTDPRTVCGVKIFMGSSTGNLLVDKREILDEVFSKVKMLIATHCEDEATILANEALFKEKYGDSVPIEMHPIIRNEMACFKSSSFAVELAKKHGTRLHILHISTKDELDLFDNTIPLSQKKITSEVCVHHLRFNSDDYARLGSQIKCNPAVKSRVNQEALLPALLDDRLDIIATDHAPHTWEEKQGQYFNCPSGVPLVQHSLNVMLEFYHQGKISLEKIVEKMCHAPAICFNMEERGFIREGFHADLVLIDLEKEWEVRKPNILYKCQWSPFEKHTFKGAVISTFVNGHLAYHKGQFDESRVGQRLLFNR